MLRVAVAGAAGRMGVRIIHAVQAEPQAELGSALEAAGHAAIGKSVAEISGISGLGMVLQDDLEAVLAACDLMIDFTIPKATITHVEAAAKAGKALVIGTTGLDQSQRDIIARAAHSIPIVFAPNMSVGMNYMFKLVHDMARVLGEDYDLELVEAHHDQKKDAPSGSAVRLIESLAAARGWDPKEVCSYGREGLVGARPKKQIGVGVIRGGDIVGDHTVYFIGQGERVELTHRAQSRDTFAKGALRAAIWLRGKKPGLYSMQDVLGIS